MKNKKIFTIEEKVSYLENMGCIVMLPPHVEKAITKAKEDEEKRVERLRNKAFNDISNDFDNMLKSKNFSVSAVEDMVHGHGFDLDDLENMIHNYY